MYNHVGSDFSIFRASRAWHVKNAWQYNKKTYESYIKNLKNLTIKIKYIILFKKIWAILKT